MDQTWDRACRLRPSTASVQVRELSWQGLHNPCPQAKGPDSHGDGHSQRLVEEYLSPARLVSARGLGPTRGDRLEPMSSLHSVSGSPDLSV